MDGFCSGIHGSFYDRLDIEIALRGRCRADMHRLIGHFDMQRIRVCIGINCDSDNAHFACGADNPAGNFSAIGNQYLFEHLIALTF